MRRIYEENIVLEIEGWRKRSRGKEKEEDKELREW